MKQTAVSGFAQKVSMGSATNNARVRISSVSPVIEVGQSKPELAYG